MQRRKEMADVWKDSEDNIAEIYHLDDDKVEFDKEPSEEKNWWDDEEEDYESEEEIPEEDWDKWDDISDDDDWDCDDD